jgi:glutathione synthase/RimK-type ligase-like ATP-grasp enzyme
VARACGFDVPDTLLTNDLGQARAFAARHGLVVYKGAGGTRTYTGLLDLADTRRLERLSTCPTYFQRYIAGTNVRVHVVGTDVFPVEIMSDAIDYRAAPREMGPGRLPESVAERCRAVTKALDLLVAGLDLIRTPDGDWYFLEANPSPAFTFYPDRAEVGAAIARLLAQPGEDAP